ncbi:hypothetical protein ABEB36_003718 [Hypothenemus hampei]|uniref:Uncharacterized protein n=1 Tax=Hypothenemus hampei TaxID=57062 RepID=A0ABD1F0Y3_HYPHA
MSALAMPFIDNDLLWSSDHDGKMVDLSSCLQDASVAIGTQSPATSASTSTSAALGELSQSDLTNLVPSVTNSNEQDTSNIGDADDIFKHLNDTTAIEIENILSEFNNPPYIKQEENNNTISNDQSSRSHSPQRSPTIAELGRKFTIAAANPILAEKLATPSEQNLNPSTPDGGRQLATLTPKTEKVLRSISDRGHQILFSICKCLNRKKKSLFFFWTIYVVIKKKNRLLSKRHTRVNGNGHTTLVHQFPNTSDFHNLLEILDFEENIRSLPYLSCHPKEKGSTLPTFVIILGLNLSIGLGFLTTYCRKYKTYIARGIIS